MTQEEFKTRYHYNPAADKLGEGGFGSVFKAYDTHRDRWVALKISKVNPDYESIRLKKEVEMVAQLPSHPNIAYYEECYTFPFFDGEYDFGVLQYYDQGNLAQLLKQGGLLPEQKYRLLTQILAGVEFLHGHGIIHRDLKPQNILMVKRGGEYVPKITDFGISKQLDVNKSSVFSNSIAGAGTLAYASPEQLGDRTIRKNADLWSFGVIAYQVLTGALPFTTGEHAVTSEAGRLELFRQVNSGQLPAAVSSIPEPWQRLIRACLVVDPEKRVKSCAEATAILVGSKKPATSTVTVEERTQVDRIKQVEERTQVDKVKQVEEKAQAKQPPAQPKVAQESKTLKWVITACLLLFYAFEIWGTNFGNSMYLLANVLALGLPATLLAVIILLVRKKLRLPFGISLILVSMYGFLALIFLVNTGLSAYPLYIALLLSALTLFLMDFRFTQKEIRNYIWVIYGIAGLVVLLTSVLPTSLEMVFVQGGTFTMGCTAEQGDDCTDREKPAHRVTVSSFQIGKYEVTQAQWKAVMGYNPSYSKGNNRPVENVSWDDAQEFISRLNATTGKRYRLPTEAEWEYAARGGNRSRGYKYSGSNNYNDVDRYFGCSHPVGRMKANELGIHDMSGNVWEWCQDWYDDYSASPQQNPTGAGSGSNRVLRGGGWHNVASNCRVASRNSDAPSSSNVSFGFRLVLP